MAMSNNKKEPKLKAGIAEFVGPLLKRLELVKKQVSEDLNTEEVINQIRIEVLKTKGDLDIRENCDMELTGCFAKIERQIDYWVDQNDKTTELNEHFRTNLKVVLNQLEQNQRKNKSYEVRETIYEVGESSKNASDLPQKEPITEASANSIYEKNIVSRTLKYIESLDPHMVRCMYSLGIFPENTKLKKRLVIYWWIALGLLPFKGDTSRIIEQGEFFFSYLVGKEVITPVNVREHNQVNDSCIIKPTIHKQLISACERDGCIIAKSGEDGTWHLYKYNKFHMDVLLNLNQRYLYYKGINDIYNKHDSNFKVIQLGSWHYTETETHNAVGKTESEGTKSKDHIEVDDTQFLNELSENVTYLSLRGISRIEELPESIGKLENLKILDLRACHNLEKLPEKSRSIFKQKLITSALHQESWFKNLVVLDTSECYLLDHMPKWVCELSNLQVLKGFVVGSVGNKNQSCKLSDLSNLKNLWKLNIRIRIEPGTEDFSGLKTLNNLLVLTIIWRGNKGNNKGITYSLPKNLEKLDIRCYPEAEASELLNPVELTNLKRLYIRGGMLTKIRNDARWEVEILRLKFLKNLKTNWVELRRSFENLKYVEYVECPELESFPEGRSHWTKEKDEPNHGGNASDLPLKETIIEVGELSKQVSDLPQKETIFEVGESSKNASDLPQKEPITKASANSIYEKNIVSRTLKYIESLDPHMVRCMYSLGIFPENTKLKKRLMIYWWIALGLLPFKGDTSKIIEQGEFFFSYLVSKEVITPVNVRGHNQVNDSCIIKPTIHKQLISACERDGCIISKPGEDGTWHLFKYNKFHMDVLINLNQRYLYYKGINDIYNKHDSNFKVIQLGSWHYTETETHNAVGKTKSEGTKSKDHIEVDDTQFLNELSENVTYLSLRGISRVEELPKSIAKLENLKILDLRACHNLVKLPEKSRSTFKQKLIRSALHQESWFKNLVVLDTSECYLLDHMPKWVGELSNLEVLKGFVVGSVGNKNQSCQLSDLSKLKNLWKLSITIRIEHSGIEDFSGLKPLNNLLVLTISWRGNKDNNEGITYSLPKNLEKLDIRCYPETEASELLNPAELKNLKRLYIRGGKLTKIRNDARWEVEILRLQFLKNLKTNWGELRRSFENLKYVEYVECPELESFPEGRSHWTKEKDEPNHGGNASDLPLKETIIEVRELSKQVSDLPQKETIFEVGESSKNASDLPQKEPITEASVNSIYEKNIVSRTLKYIESLDPHMVRCMYSLGIFPENTKLKKRLMIYWWIALGLLPFKGDTSRIIEQGEFFFSYLVSKEVITPVNFRGHNQVNDSCIIKPTIHKQLISACERDGCIISKPGEDGTWHLFKYNKFHMDVLINLNQRYLYYKGINDIYNKHDSNFKVIQLGSWHYTETETHNAVGKTKSEGTKSKDHIEVDDTQFLNELSENVTYLSLRGISRVEELPESIAKLENLKILDLRACHNLVNLPEKSRSTFKQKLIRSALHQESWFKNLVVLDTSECYLLDHMPNWVGELSNLEVLKGFVVGSVGNKNQSCQLSDLSKLKNLWKLSITIRIEHSGIEDFSGLKPLNNLLVLTISWRGNKDNNEGITYSLPKNLEKLDIRCYPETEASELLNPAELKNLKRLYIRGGKLTKIRNDARWEVEILRLQFLKNLKTNWVELRRSFGNLKYLEYVECPELENFPEGRSHWIKEKDEPNHGGIASEISNQS